MARSYSYGTRIKLPLLGLIPVLILLLQPIPCAHLPCASFQCACHCPTLVITSPSLLSPQRYVPPVLAAFNPAAIASHHHTASNSTQLRRGFTSITTRHRHNSNTTAAARERCTNFPSDVCSCNCSSTSKHTSAYIKPTSSRSLAASSNPSPPSIIHLFPHPFLPPSLLPFLPP